MDNDPPVRPPHVQAEMDGMRAVPDTGAEPWATRLKPPHPVHVARVAGALITVTESLTQAYMVAYTLDDAGLLATPAAQPAINVTVDREANAAYVRVAEGVVFRTAEINSSVNADYDQGAQLLGVEILGLPLAPAAPADDEATVRALVDAMKGTREFRAGVIFGVPNDAVDLFAEGLARAALAALRQGEK